MTDPIHGAEAPVIHELGSSGTAPVIEPVTRTGRAPGTSRGRWRWIVALVTVALVAVATIGGAVLLTGARSASTVARWAPADSLVYAELRADLPGDQRDQLAAFLSAFPGFADRSILDQKLAEVYDRLLSAATGGKQAYQADIAPWFGGQLGVAVEAPADPTAAAGTPPPTLLIATSTDPSKALEWVRSTGRQAGATVADGQLDGRTVVRLTADGRTLVAAAPSGVLLVGPEADVAAAITGDGTGGLAADPDFQAAGTALAQDALGTVYVHVRAYATLLSELPHPSAAPTPLAGVTELLPVWAVASIRAESDALAFDAAAPAGPLSGAVADSTSKLPDRLPAATVALAESHDVGTAVTAMFDQLPGGAEKRAQLDQALQPVGGLDGLLGWMAEAGMAVIKVGDQAVPGAVAIPTDPAAAETLARNLANVATLAGLPVTRTTDGGTTITTVDLSKLAATMASGASSPDLRSLSWAVTDRIVVVGPTPAYVSAVLAAGSGPTLADQSGFGSLVARVGGQHRGLVWADLAAIRDLVAAGLPAAERTHYTTDIEPYLAPLDAMVGVVSRDGSLDRAAGLLVVHHP